MNKLHKVSQKGFTIVELLIVIVVIGILAALVLNSFSGVQAKARDTERQTDTKALATQLEAWYSNTDNTQGGYPSTLTLNATWANTNLKGIDANSLNAPGLTSGLTAATAASTTETGTTLAPTPTKDTYVYEARNGTALCNAASPASNCNNFRLWYVKENGGLTLVKSLNQP